MKSTSTLRRYVCVLLALPLLCIGVSASAHDENPPRILVTGQGRASLAPDMAIVSLTVTREAATARGALTANSAAMKKVLQAMQDLGVAQRDLQTANFNIQPRYSRPVRGSKSGNEAPQIIAYSVRNGLTVRLREIDKVGEVLDTAVTLGVNEGGNIQFTNSDSSNALEQARKHAVTQARKKAETLAAAAGLKLGQVLEITEQSHNPRPMPMARGAMMMSDAAGSVPVAQGENTYKVDVTLSYGIDYYPVQDRLKP